MSDQQTCDFLHNVQPYILVGGLSQRFGSPKALLEINGVRHLDRLCMAIHDQLDTPPILIQRRDAETPLISSSYPTIFDAVPSQGAICGIATGLMHLQQANSSQTSQRTWCLFVTCDLFAWTSPILMQLSERVSKDVKKWIRIAVFELPDRKQPFPSLWHINTAAEVTATANSSQRSILKFLEGRIDLDCRSIDDPQRIASFNTPLELEQLMNADATKTLHRS